MRSYETFETIQVFNTKKQMKFNNGKIIYNMKVFTISVFVYSMQLRGVVYPATTNLFT